RDTAADAAGDHALGHLALILTSRARGARLPTGARGSLGDVLRGDHVGIRLLGRLLRRGTTAFTHHGVEPGAGLAGPGHRRVRVPRTPAGPETRQRAPLTGVRLEDRSIIRTSLVASDRLPGLVRTAPRGTPVPLNVSSLHTRLLTGHGVDLPIRMSQHDRLDIQHRLGLHRMRGSTPETTTAITQVQHHTTRRPVRVLIPEILEAPLRIPHPTGCDMT